MLVLKNGKYWRPLEGKHTWKTFCENWSMGPKTEIHTYTWTNTNCLQFLSCCKIMRKLTVFCQRTCAPTRTHKYMHACIPTYTYIQMGNKYRLENPMNIWLVKLIKIAFYILCSFINPFRALTQIALLSQDEPDIIAQLLVMWYCNIQCIYLTNIKNPKQMPSLGYLTTNRLILNTYHDISYYCENNHSYSVTAPN